MGDDHTREDNPDLNPDSAHPSIPADEKPSLSDETEDQRRSSLPPKRTSKYKQRTLRETFKPKSFAEEWQEAMGSDGGELPQPGVGALEVGDTPGQIDLALLMVADVLCEDVDHDVTVHVQ